MKIIFLLLAMLCFITTAVASFNGNNTYAFELTMYGWTMIIMYTLTTIKERLDEHMSKL